MVSGVEIYSVFRIRRNNTNFGGHVAVGGVRLWRKRIGMACLSCSVGGVGGVEFHLQPQVYLQIGKQRACCHAESCRLLPRVHASFHVVDGLLRGNALRKRIHCACSNNGNKLRNGIFV